MAVKLGQFLRATHEDLNVCGQLCGHHPRRPHQPRWTSGPVLTFELAVYRDEHIVPPPPDADRAFVVAGARSD